jgi:DNA-binding IclR family transcriptional regulator
MLRRPSFCRVPSVIRWTASFVPGVARHRAAPGVTLKPRTANGFPIPVDGPRAILEERLAVDTQEPDVQEAPRYSAPAAACAADVLKLLSSAARPLTVAEMARSLGVSKSLAFRVVRELELREFVGKADGHRYRLGFTAMEIGAVSMTRSGYAEAARPILRRIAEQTQGNANLAVLRGAQILYLVREECDDAVVTATQVGSKLPANCTALGKVLLAGLRPEELELRLAGEYPRLTARSKGTARALAMELAKVRRRGFASSEGEAFRGRACVAISVAMPGLAERVAISLSAAADGFVERRFELVKALVAARQELEAPPRMRSLKSGAA